MDRNLPANSFGMANSSANPPTNNRILNSIDSNALFAAGRSRPQISELREIGILMNSRRPVSHNPFRGLASACIDEDDSGTYDPKDESRLKQAGSQPRRTKRTKKAKRQDSEEDASLEGKSPQGGETEYSLPVTFALTSGEGVDYLRSITPGPFEDDAISSSSDSGSESLDNENGVLPARTKSPKPARLGKQEARDDGLTADQLTEGHPQRRGCKSCFEAGDDDCSLIEHAYAYPCAACTDADIDCELIVPPEFKRVCERCKKKRIACSYKIDGGKGVDACDCCRQAGLTCYAGPLRDTHSKRFHEEKADLTPAAPPKAAAPLIPNPAPPRKYVACNQCRGEGARCSLKREQTGPCRHCKLNEKACELVLIPTARTVPSKSAAALRGNATSNATAKKKAILKKVKDRSKLLQKRALKAKKKKSPKRGSRTARARRPPPPKPRSTNGITHTIIRTSFAHPITFNHISAPNGSSPCHWCAGPFFGLFGHGERAVEVIPMRDGHGYEEIGDIHVHISKGGGDDSNGRRNESKNNKQSNINNRQAPRQRDLRGHNQLGHERSQMCVDCTFSRVHAMACAAHEMKRLEDLDERIFHLEEWGRAHAALAAGDDEGGRLVRESRWCSVCPALAEYGCVAAEEDDGCDCDDDGEEVEVKCAKGCGFVLCVNCNDLLDKIEREKEFSRNAQEMNVLDRLVRMVDADKYYYPIGARADASFLTTEGELNQRLEHGFGRDGDVESDNDEDDEGDDESSSALKGTSDGEKI